MPSTELDDVARQVASAWSAHAAGRAAAEEARRDALLASDADRDRAARLLADAYATGRLSPAQFEERTGRALSASTLGALDDVLQGLGRLERPARSHPWRRAFVLVIAFLTSPFALIGTLLLLFGSDIGDRVGGIVILVVLLPGLFALWRWAWPRR